MPTRPMEHATHVNGYFLAAEVKLFIESVLFCRKVPCLSSVDRKAVTLC